jgi:hypothetical protein
MIVVSYESSCKGLVVVGPHSGSWEWPGGLTRQALDMRSAIAVSLTHLAR